MNDIDESLSFILPGPQSPCERTDLRMAIVADHLGLSWTGETYSKLLLFFDHLSPQTLSFTDIFRLIEYLTKSKYM